MSVCEGVSALMCRCLSVALCVCVDFCVGRLFMWMCVFYECGYLFIYLFLCMYVYMCVEGVYVYVYVILKCLR